jgi:predicted dehydrogenase
MGKIRIGVLGPADIAKRRMVPAMMKNEGCEYIGVALATESEHGLSGSDTISERTRKKGEDFVSEFGGRIFEGYEAMLASDAIDAVYIALPPALHFRWAMKALESGKHVLLEKPFTTRLEDTQALLEAADKRGLAVAENFGFIYHRQVSVIKDIMASGKLGDLRLIRSNFGFPFRGGEDFRYHKALGGGALLDCGCYTLRMASELMGEDMRIYGAGVCGKDGFDVDIYGTISAGTPVGSGEDAPAGVTAQLSFGMDQQYCCSLEIWGSKGSLQTGRIYTAPPTLATEIEVCTGMEREILKVEPDDQFGEILSAFIGMTFDEEKRQGSYDMILRQADLMEQVAERSRL